MCTLEGFLVSTSALLATAASADPGALFLPIAACRRWNPVQGGSWQNGPPKVLASSMGAASATVAAVPRNWGGQQLLDDVLMITEAELHPNVVKVGQSC